MNRALYGLCATAVLLVSPLMALDGDTGMHDPSTVVMHDGKFYAYGTGNGLPISVSDDGWTCKRSPWDGPGRMCLGVEETTHGPRT